MYSVAIIPAYNESRTIANIVVGAGARCSVVAVIDDGSTDQTGGIARRYGALVIRQENSGAGSAIRKGIMKFYSPNVYSVVTLDADGQHDPRDIGFLLGKVKEGYDFVIGTRNFDGRMPFPRLAGNRILCFARNFGSKVKISDAECGYRAYSRRFLENIRIETDGFGFCEETAIKARALGMKICEVPIETVYGEDKHKYGLLKDFIRGIGILFSIVKYRWLYEWRPWSKG